VMGGRPCRKAGGLRRARGLEVRGRRGCASSLSKDGPGLDRRNHRARSGGVTCTAAGPSQKKLLGGASAQGGLRAFARQPGKIRPRDLRCASRGGVGEGGGGGIVQPVAPERWLKQLTIAMRIPQAARATRDRGRPDPCSFHWPPATATLMLPSPDLLGGPRRWLGAARGHRRGFNGSGGGGRGGTGKPGAMIRGLPGGGVSSWTPGLGRTLNHYGTASTFSKAVMFGRVFTDARIPRLRPDEAPGTSFQRPSKVADRRA